MTVRESAYDEVADAALDFRVLLSAMSRPGQIHDLGQLPLDPPAPLAPASASVALALLSIETGFATSGLPNEAAAYISLNTRSERVDHPAAHFIFFGSADQGEQHLADAQRGTPHYPDQGATVVAQLAELSSEPLPGGLQVHATGPGVDGAAVFFATGLHPVWLATLRSCNAEYPLGVDAIFTCGSRVVCLPRSTSFSWE